MRAIWTRVDGGAGPRRGGATGDEGLNQVMPVGTEARIKRGEVAMPLG